jgi:hypothetical protein
LGTSGIKACKRQRTRQAACMCGQDTVQHKKISKTLVMKL